MTIPPTEIQAKARVNSTVSYPSKDPSVVGELSCISSVDPWIMGVTLNSVSSTRRQVGAEHLLLDSGAHTCPLTYPVKTTPQMTRFRDVKVCINLATDEIDDHRNTV